MIRFINKSNMSNNIFQSKDINEEIYELVAMIEYRPFKEKIYSSIYHPWADHIPINAIELCKKYYYDEILFYLHLGLASSKRSNCNTRSSRSKQSIKGMTISVKYSELRYFLAKTKRNIETTKLMKILSKNLKQFLI